MSGQVVHFEIPADDVERASAFYRSAFDWSVTGEPGMNYWALRTTETDDDGMPSEPGSINGGMFAVEIGHRDREMAIAVSKIVGLHAALVDRQLKLEFGFGIAHVDEREGFEVQPVGDFETEGPVVEIHGRCLVQNADHGMN